jgi:hypothetical protein
MFYIIFAFFSLSLSLFSSKTKSGTYFIIIYPFSFLIWPFQVYIINIYTREYEKKRDFRFHVYLCGLLFMNSWSSPRGYCEWFVIPRVSWDEKLKFQVARKSDYYCNKNRSQLGLTVDKTVVEAGFEQVK